MTALATNDRRQEVATIPTAQATRGPNPALMTLDEIWQMAEYVAGSKMYGMQNPQQAFVLMMLCQSKGLHPISAVERYHIIEGKPSMQAITIAAEFKAKGGKIAIVRTDHEEARAIFSHPVLQPEPIELHENIKEYAHLASKTNWRNNAKDMLWWRLMSKAIKKIDPGITVGITSDVEIHDMLDADSLEVRAAEQVRRADVQLTRSAPALPTADAPILGYTGSGHDMRPYATVVTDAVQAANAAQEAKWGLAFPTEPCTLPEILAPGLHQVLWEEAAALGHITSAKPAKTSERIRQLTVVYREQRAWLRERIDALLADKLERVEELITDRASQRDPEPPDDDTPTGPPTAPSRPSPSTPPPTVPIAPPPSQAPSAAGGVPDRRGAEPPVGEVIPPRPTHQEIGERVPGPPFDPPDASAVDPMRPAPASFVNPAPPKPPKAAKPEAPPVFILGGSDEPDERPYLTVVTDGVRFVNAQVAASWAHDLPGDQGGPSPATVSSVHVAIYRRAAELNWVAKQVPLAKACGDALAKVYGTQRAWTRQAIQTELMAILTRAGELIEARRLVKKQPAPMTQEELDAELAAKGDGDEEIDDGWQDRKGEE